MPSKRSELLGVTVLKEKKCLCSIDSKAFCFSSDNRACVAGDDKLSENCLLNTSCISKAP